MESNTASINLHNLSTGYGQHVVAKSINATLESGTLTCLLGPNGAGKSTLLRTLAGFQPALAGEILIAERNLSEYSPRELSTLVGVVLTDRVDIQGITVAQLAGMGRSPYTGFWGRLSDEDAAIVNEALAQVGITHLSERLVNTLSDGERQKVMLAKALAQSTPIILLDEPTAFLDFPSKVEMMRLLRRLAHQMHKTIFLSTHDVEMAMRLADTLWLMTKGELHTGTCQQLVSEGELQRFVCCEGVHFDEANGTFLIDRE